MSESYLPAGLPIPVPERSGLSKPFWDGLREEILKVQESLDHAYIREWAPRLGVEDKLEEMLRERGQI